MSETRVLLVEDETIVARDIEHSLEQLGYLVCGRAASGPQAIELAGETRPDLVLMDIKLHGEMDGLEAAELIYQKWDLPVVYLTAFADQQTLAQARTSGAYGYLLKPFDEKELHSTIETALYRHEMESRLRASEARYRAIVEDQTDLICRFREDGVLTYANEAFTRFFGLEDLNAGGRSLLELMAEADPEQVGMIQAWLQSGQDTGRVELSFRRPGGELVWVQWVHHAIRDERGWLVEYQSVGRDVTDRKLAELRLRERQRFIELLNDLTRTALETTEMPALLQLLADQICDLFEADGCFLTLLDPETGAVIPAAASGQWRDRYPLTQVIRGKQTMTESALRAGTPLLVQDARNSPYVSPEITADFPHRSYLVLPLLDGEDKLGAMLIGYTESHDFSLQEVTQGEQAAALAALALAKMRLLEQTEARWREAETLRQATAAVSEIRSLDQTLALILEQLERVVPYDSASIELLHLDGETFEIVSIRGVPEPAELLGVRFSATGNTINAVLRRSGAPVLIDDIQRGQATYVQLPQVQVRAWLGVPLKAGERLIGMLAVVSAEPAHFTSRHVALAIPFANQAAIAIENARLVQRLEEAVAQRSAEARGEQEKSAAILRSVSDAIVLTDLDLAIRYVNPAFVRLTGYSESEAQGRPIIELLACNLADWQREALTAALARGEGWQGELALKRKDGRCYAAALALSPVLDADGQLSGYVASQRDISQRKELELAQQRFITNVSHQLRTPATSIKLYTELLTKLELPAKAGRYLGVLLEQEERLIALIQDILRMAELESGGGLGSWRAVRVESVAHELAAAYQELARAAGVELVEEPAPQNLPPVMGDRNRLVQALDELLENAVTFTPMRGAGGRIVVRAALQESEGRRWVTLSVRDNGPGIAPAEQERVFDPFVRGAPAESGHLPGTGLGLALVQRIAQAHGGRITLESEFGQGSTFTLWLPAA